MTSVKLDEALCRLTPPEREVVEMYFGLNGRMERDVMEIAMYYGWSQQSVRNIGKKALKKLHLRSAGLQSEFLTYFPKKF